ncbi:putative single-stranded DNA binding protein [Bacillus phage pW2]|uniref:Putative single-stranded DNA binding protein n=1 Tax=Bacillus phage pW2 TaxID=2500559 RepID=A0A3T0IHW8_9CAUD|nr:putative single-stranded DNA binding protein [Bacillus phage pW2]AZU99014.1 putative single-stranded DNA binding protein [Bacillus phage pW2]
MARNKKERTELKQNKSEFKFIGKVTNADKEGFFVEDQAKSGEREGQTFRRMKFGIRTSETNTLQVQMFAYEPEEVFLWNSKLREENPEFKGERIPYEEWLEDADEYREKGYTATQARVGLEFGEDGKVISHGVPDYQLADILSENVENGDLLKVEGEIRYNKFQNQAKEWVEQVQWTIKKVHIVKEEDLTKEDAEEMNYFSQEFVFIDAEHIKKEKKTIVTGRVIDFRKKWYDKQFEVVYKDSEGNEDAELKELATGLAKEVKFGDVLTVWGYAVNRVIVTNEKSEEEQKEEKRKKNLLSGLGGKAQPKHAERYTGKKFEQGLQIQGVVDWQEKVYDEDDFPNQELIQEESTSKKASGLGGKKSKTNPFAKKKEEENPLEGIDESDLPF